MSAFHETLKKVFTAVDSFLNTTLKNESLGKKAEKEKTKLLELLQKLYSDYEYLSPSSAEEESPSSPKDTQQDESRNTISSNHSNEDEPYNNDDIPDITVKALSNPIEIGFLQKKRTGLFSKPQKCYCVIHKNVMYWYKKSSDKKQQGSFITTGYEFREIPQSEKEISKKEFPFELVCIGKKSFQFATESKIDLEKWKVAVATSSKYVPTPSISESASKDDLSFMEEGEELYEPIDGLGDEIKSQSVADTKPLSESAQHLPSSPTSRQEEFNEINEDDCFEETYDAAESEKSSVPELPSRNPNPPMSASQVPPQATLTATALPSNAAPPVSEIDAFDDGDVYEFVDNTIPASSNTKDSPPPLPDPRSSIPTCPPPLPPVNRSAASESNLPPPLPSRGAGFGQSTEKANKELPPLPPKKRSLTLEKLEFGSEDYENLYYGIWKCCGASENELSFEEGEIIRVINKELDAENWWVGELRGKIGMVPKPYLYQAYEMVA